MARSDTGNWSPMDNISPLSLLVWSSRRLPALRLSPSPLTIRGCPSKPPQLQFNAFQDEVVNLASFPKDGHPQGLMNREPPGKWRLVRTIASRPIQPVGFVRALLAPSFCQ